MIIAIDHGNYAIKTLNHSFVAGLSEHTVKPPMTDEIMEYDGRHRMSGTLFLHCLRLPKNWKAPDGCLLLNPLTLRLVSRRNITAY